MKKKKQKKYKNLMFVLLTSISFSFLTYSYAIASTTFSVSSIKNQETKIAELRTNIAELDFEYFELMNDISVKKFEEFNLKEVKNIAYVSLDTDKKITYNY